jgi:hypothetical protein
MPDSTARTPRILALWSPPRARSTVFYRVMLQRGDLTALHEPFCNLADYGETEVGTRTVRSGAELIAAMWATAEGGRPLFFKDTTDHRYPAVLADERFLRDVRHTFLIRHPAEIAASFTALKPDMSVEEIGLELMYELYRAVLDAGGAPPVVVDSDQLVNQPGPTIAAYCAAVGLPHRTDALRWTPAARPEWRRTDRWHQRVNHSTGIEATSTAYARTVHNDPVLARLAAHHEPFYRLLWQQRLVLE